MLYKLLVAAVVLGATLSAQISQQQKIDDLRTVASLYAKRYAPYEWKKQSSGFDLFDLQPWIDRALATDSDLEFLDILVEYVASLNDAHDTVSFPFNFTASLGFTLDIYDWRVLVDSVNRTQLPLAQYPIDIGDELVSLDGVTAQEWIWRLAKYSISANPRSTARSAVARIATRSQSRIPWAPELGENAEVVIRRVNGELRTLTIRWQKSGIPMSSIGRVPDVRGGKPTSAATAAGPLAWDETLPEYAAPLQRYLNARIPDQDVAVLGSGARSPIYTYLPAGFQQRLGRAAADVFFSGTFEFEGLRMGLIRIPSYSPGPGTAEALRQFDAEIDFFQANTDGLIIDEMRNPGGLVSYVEELCRRLIHYPFRALGFEVRATAADVVNFGQSAAIARQTNQPEHIVRQLELRYQLVLEAFRANRGISQAVSLTGPTLDLLPVTASDGRVLAYSKPIICLVDGFSASGGDAFPATLQDNARALIVGQRTMGAGGSVVNWPATYFSEAQTRVTETLMNRKNLVRHPDYPVSFYVENVGVYPEVELEYMTQENLLTGGRPFVEAFIRVAAAHIRRNR